MCTTGIFLDISEGFTYSVTTFQLPNVTVLTPRFLSTSSKYMHGCFVIVKIIVSTVAQYRKTKNQLSIAGKKLQPAS